MIRKVVLLLAAMTSQGYALPKDFVYLKNIDPSILQDMRYAGYHNFIGRPIKGYEGPECILTKQAALALHDVQTELKKQNLSLKVYDCYRPQMAVNDFITWSQIPVEQSMKKEFYPRIEKLNAFKLGYIARKSGHSRGSTVDLTIVSLPAKEQASYRRGQLLTPCFNPYPLRFQDNSIDMGTGYDCLDPSAHGNYQNINAVAFRNRQLLRAIMEKNHFEPYAPEWWHFTLKNEPFPHAFFNFLVRSERGLK
jgi:zinc D-Ala-D-Ala dipeptidase